MDSINDNDFDQFFKPVGRQTRVSMKPLSVSNSNTTNDRKAGFYGSLPKSPQGVRKSLFEPRNKENEEFSLCKDFSVDRNVTGKTPIVILSRPKNGSNSDKEKEERKIKPRRSMLGLRSKNALPTLSKDDCTYAIPKPLHSSSPVNTNRFEGYKSEGHFEPRLQKATSTPTLNHPFDSNDADASAFFSKGFSDSTWSVFKSKKEDSKNYPSETPLSRGSGLTRSEVGDTNNSKNDFRWKGNSTYSSRPSVSNITSEQKMQLEWLANKVKHNESLSSNAGKELSIPERIEENTVEESSDLPKSYNNERRSKSKLSGSLQTSSTYGTRTRAQLKREKEKYMSESISPIIGEVENITTQLEDTTICDKDDSRDSNDSYVQNEATIVGTCKKLLTDITEESSPKLAISPKSKSSVEKSEDSDEYLSTNEAEENVKSPPNFNNILSLLLNLKKEKEDMDCKLTDFLNQKEIYDKQLNDLTMSLNAFADSTKNMVYSKNKILKKVISTKARPSLVRSPYSSLSQSATKSGSKNYSGLKSNFNFLKTPIHSNKKLKKLRKSTCYTPNSLSVLVGDQVKDIFGEM